MKKIKIFMCNAALMLLVLMLVGCSDDANKQSKNNNPTSESTIKSDSTEEPEETVTSDSNEVTSESIINDNNKSNETDKESDSLSELHNGVLRTDTDINDQQKAISLVKDYLRSKNELFEDENHFVEYDGQINDYIIVRYSTLLTDHSSTNGRYGVHIETGEIAPNIFF